jgi:hypothetical protein
MKEYTTSSHRMTNQPVKCNHCGNSASMAIICQGEHVYVIEDERWGSEDWTREWKILLCTNCDNVTVIQTSHSSTNESPIGEDAQGNEILDRSVTKSILFPSPKREFEHLPVTISRSYDIAVKLIAIEPIASAVFAGRTLEFLCNDCDAKGNNLFEKIKFLGEQELLPRPLVEMAQSLRVFRNIAAHDPQVKNTIVSKDDAGVLCDICAVILEYIYELPAMLSRVQEKIKSVENNNRDATP